MDAVGAQGSGCGRGAGVRAGLAYVLILLAGGGCSPPAFVDSGVVEELASGVSVWHRDPGGVPLTDAVVRVGGYSAEPLANGVTIFPRIYPGHVTMRAITDELALAHATVEVVPQGFHGVQLVTGAGESLAFSVVEGGGSLTLGPASLECPVGAVGSGGQPYSGEAGVRGLWVDETSELALPGTGIALREDQYLDEFEMLAALRLTPEPPVDNALLEPATLTIPLEGVSASTTLFAYTFDGGQGYWKRAQSVSLVEGQVEVVAGQFGWWAIGSAPRTDRTCVVGSVRDAQGQPLPFADVVVRESAAFGRRNMSTDDLGRFCIDVVPDSEIQLDVYGLRADEPQFQYWSRTTWSPDLPETSTCADPVACADLGGIATELLVVR